MHIFPRDKWIKVPLIYNFIGTDKINPSADIFYNSICHNVTVIWLGFIGDNFVTFLLVEPNFWFMLGGWLEWINISSLI